MRHVPGVFLVLSVFRVICVGVEGSFSPWERNNNLWQPDL